MHKRANKNVSQIRQKYEEKVFAGAGLGTIASANHSGPKTSPRSPSFESASREHTSSGSNKSG